eukprot:208779_1
MEIYSWCTVVYNCYYPAPPQKPICLTNETINDKYLFNLKNDPYEANNLIEVFPEIADYMIGLIVDDAINNGYVYNYLDATWNSSCPRWHNGCWVPWLENQPVNDHIIPQCGMLQ